MTKVVALLCMVFMLTGCPSVTVIRCGGGTIAVPDGVDPDGPGFFVDQDGQNYVDGSGDIYDDVTCTPIVPVRLCGPNTVAAPAGGGDQVNPDGGGFFVDQDGPGFFVDQDGSVPAEEVCVAAEPPP